MICHYFFRRPSTKLLSLSFIFSLKERFGVLLTKLFDFLEKKHPYERAIGELRFYHGIEN